MKCSLYKKIREIYCFLLTLIIVATVLGLLMKIMLCIIKMRR